MKFFKIFILILFLFPFENKARVTLKREIKINIEWHLLIRALSEIESNNNPLAYNPKSGALGILQQKRIYVDEVNRILALNKSSKKYKYEDRKSPKKAKEMFEIYQQHHNPKKDIKRAIILHRGLNSYKYNKAVINKINFYKNGK